MRETIAIRGAREHNLKNVDLDIPRNRLVVITGVSGSGKSTLAFDTLFAEGQRRYVESLSAYARQFLEQMDKPDVDTIEGLSPAISIEQKTTSKNPRSTVATVTEIYDYLRLLFASIGQAFCPDCGIPIQGQTTQQMADRILALPAGTRFLLLAPLAESRKGEHRKLFEQMVREGFVRARVDGAARRRRLPARPRQEAQAHRRGRDRPPRGAPRPRQPPRRLARDRAQGRRRRGADRARGRARSSCSPRVTPARSADSPSPSCRRACSRSTPRRARARPAPASASCRRSTPTS